MPTVAELERLKALTDRLVPFSDVGRGEVIEAANWNTLVQTLIEVTRAVLGQDTDTVVPPHEHPDQVTIGWLDPQLRATIERGPLSDPALSSRFDALERKVDRLAMRLEEVNSAISEVRVNINEISTRDLTRQADVTAVRRSIDGLADSRESVLQLRESLRGIQGDLTVAVGVGRQLTINGQPLDVQGLLGRVSGLEELRTRLTTPQGTLLDANSLEQRLTDLTNKLVTQEQLDQVVHNIGTRLPPEVLDGIRTDIGNQLTAQVNTSLDRLSDEIRGNVNAQLAGIDGIVGNALNNALPRVQQDILNNVRPEIASAISASEQNTQQSVQKQLDVRDTNLRNEMTDRIASSQRDTDQIVQKLVSVQLDERLNPLEETVKKMQGDVTDIFKRIERVGLKVDTVSTRAEEVLQLSLSAQDSLKKDLQQEITQRFMLKDAELDQRFTKLQADDHDFTLTSINDASTSLESKARQIATDTAATEVKLAGASLRTEMVGIARDQIVGFQDQVHGMITTEVNSAFTQVPGLVSTEVRRATANLNDQIKSEIDIRTPILTDTIINSIRRP